MKKTLLLILVLTLITSLFGCTSSTKSGTTDSIIIIDAYGEEITLEKPATRIISTYSAITENIYALGAGDSLIGGGSTELYPKEATELPSFSYSKDDVEKFIGAKPDVVFFRKSIATKYADLITNLNSAGIITIALDNEGFDNYVTTIAKVVGKDDVAKDMLKDFDKQMNELKERASKVPEDERLSIFFESTEKDYRTASHKSIAYAGLKLLGLTNVADENMDKNAKSTIAHFGDEYLLAEANNIDVYIAQHGAMNKAVTIEGIKVRPGFDVIKAIQEDRIFIVEEKLISSPTFRQIQGLEQIFEYIYPKY